MTTKRILPKAEIVKREDITEDLWCIWLKPENAFPFKPGQYITIGVDGIERAYSIVSAPTESAIELFIELVPEPDGELTPLLYKLHKGDIVSMRPRAKGVFTLDANYKKHIFIATVTGVVPYISILRDYINQGYDGNKFYILDGASYHDEFVYDSEIDDMLKKSGDIESFIPTVSRPTEEKNKEWAGETGRVNKIVGKYVSEWNLESSDTLIYACGHPQMIEDVKDEFTPQGFTVKEERFWKQ